MLPRESIEDMCICFTKIINDLKSLWKTYINEEKVRLQCLLRSKLGPKVTTIEEAHDLKTLKLDDPIRILLIHEIHLQEGNEEHAPQQGLALKSNDIEMSSEESENEEDESVAMVAKGFQKIFEKYPKFMGIWKGSTSKRND